VTLAGLVVSGPSTGTIQTADCIRPTLAAAMTFRASVLDEPLLEFGGNGREIDIRLGLMSHGPLEPERASRVRLGIIGANETIEGFGRFLDRCQVGIDAKPSRQPNLFLPFPGLANDNPFRCSFELDAHSRKPIPRSDIACVVAITSTPDAIEEAVALFSAQAQAIAESPGPPDVIVCALPLELISRVVHGTGSAPQEERDEDQSDDEAAAPDFRTDKHNRRPYLSREDAYDLLQRSLQAYSAHHFHAAARVIVYKTAPFQPEEIGGFEEALQEWKVRLSDFVWVAEDAPFRLYRDGAYPPLRGTCLELEHGALLYCRGSVPYYRTYPGLYVPKPLMLRPYHRGEPTLIDLSRETLALSKMNRNSTQFDGSSPITIRAARVVGRVLKHVSAGTLEAAEYRNYI
jgi:hypothetical protein